MATIADLNVTISASIDDFEAKMGRVQSGLGGLGSLAKSAGQSLSTFVTLPLSLLAGASIAALAKIDGLTRGLNAVSTIDLGKQGVTGLAAVTQAAAATSERLKLLQEIARAPGIGFEQAVQGDIRLRAVGIAAGQSAAVLREFANAIALTGGGAGKLDEVTVQLAQLSAKGKVLSQDLRPIIEAAPAVATALQKLYGTVDSETISKSLEKQGKSSKDFIAVLTDELGKLPRVTGGIGNSLDNFAQGATQSLAKLGDSLNKAFNIDANINRLSDFITGLADSFAALDPTAQKAIFVLAGLAAAAGPLLVVVGTIGVAIGPLALGFAALTGPIALAIAAVVALTAAGVAYAASGTDTTEAFRSQAASVKALTNSVNPLLTRYEELKAKSVLTKAEQEELRGVIEKVGRQIPTSITAFDAYGKALDINSDKAREFVKTQQEILAVKNREALTEQRAEYTRLTGQIEGATNALRQFDAQGRLVKAVFDDGGGGFQVLTGNEITALQSKLEGLSATRRGVGGLIDELKGIAPAVKEANNSLPLVPPLSEAALKALADMAKAYAEVQKSLRDVIRENQALGDVYDLMDAKQSALESGIKKLVDAGFSPFSKEVRELVLQLQKVPGLIGAIGSLELKKDVAVKTPDRALPTVLGTIDRKPLEENKKLFADFELAQQEFNANTQDLIDAFPLAGFASIANGIGDALANGGNALAGAASGLLKVLADFGAAYGKQLILMGLADVASGLFVGKGVAEIAAGTALIAGSSLLGGFGSSLSSSGSGGGGGGGSLASSPRSSFTPTTAPNITAPGGGTTRNVHNVVFELNGNKLMAAIDIETDRLGRVVGPRR